MELRIRNREAIVLTRRALVGNVLKLSAGLALSTTAGLAEPSPIRLTFDDAPPVSIPSNFIGLGYEMSSVASLGLLSPRNQKYVELIKGLGPDGVLRAGGIVADYSRYEPDGSAAAERQNTVITRTAIEDFGAFLAKIGWRAIWSVNFAQGSVEDAVNEARAVSSILKSRLLALELGNEVDNYGRGQKPFRKPPYDYETYWTEYNKWRAAVLNAVPGLSFAAPDTASSIEWVERAAKDAKGDVQLLTTHYYRNNQNRGTVDQLLSPDPRLDDALHRLQTASRQSGIPWRMCETNSFSGGGRPGVSDTFLGALWTLDYLLLLAKNGCSGVNIETGVNQLGFVSSYSPIQDDGKGINTAGVPYYGMLAFAIARAGCTQVLSSKLETKGVNLTAYLMGASKMPRALVVVNRDASQDARLSVGNLGIKNMTVLRLLAPSVDSKTDITFAGAQVNSDGKWAARTVEHLQDGVVTVPKMSAVVLRSIGMHEHV